MVASISNGTTATDDIVSGTDTPIMNIFILYTIHETRPIMNAATARDYFFSIAYATVVTPRHTKNNTETAK